MLALESSKRGRFMEKMARCATFWPNVVFRGLFIFEEEAVIWLRCFTAGLQKAQQLRQDSHAQAQPTAAPVHWHLGDLLGAPHDTAAASLPTTKESGGCWFQSCDQAYMLLSRFLSSRHNRTVTMQSKYKKSSLGRICYIAGHLSSLLLVKLIAGTVWKLQQSCFYSSGAITKWTVTAQS